MVVYKRKVSYSLAKWFLALAVFVAGMTITWDEVEGSPLVSEGTVQTQIAGQK